MKEKIIAFVCIFMLLFTIGTNVQAANAQTTEGTQKNFLDDIFGQGSTWFNSAKGTESENSFGNAIKDYINNGGIMQAVLAVGNLVFAIVTVTLGAKYIFSGIEGKSIIKETLPTFVVGVIFFYLASNLVFFFTNDAGTGVLNILFGGTPNFTTISGSIWSTISIVINTVSIAGIVFIGLRYMFAGPDSKADIKKSLLPVTLGIIFVYCAFQVLNFIVQVGNAAI